MEDTKSYIDELIAPERSQKIKTYELSWGERTLKIEVGKLAGLANGSARVQLGDTTILATAVMGTTPRTGIDYFPLMVDYKENMYAAGKISGSRWVKRDGRPTDESVLTGRLIDRSIRPLFDDRLRVDVQVVVTVLSIDGEVDPDVPGVIGAATALMVSDIPWDGPLAAAAVGWKDGQWKLIPTMEERFTNELNMLVSGRSGQAVMIEADGKQASDEKAIEAVEWTLKQLEPVTKLLKQIQKEVGREKISIEPQKKSADQAAHDAEIEQKVKQYLADKMPGLFGIPSKEERLVKEEAVAAEIRNMVEAEDMDLAMEVFHRQHEAEFRRKVLEDGVRVDGRALDEIRPLAIEIDVLPRTHGSALFQRGDTQVLSVLTLASPGFEQWIDQMEFEGKKRFLHHYNFPSFSVGEVKPMRGPSRRDIGHGALVEKALEPVVPTKEEFPYTVRIVSEVLGSNGSSSQASACASSLSLMAAGVPIKAPVAGIAMGLVTSSDKSKYKILTDIQGIEDHSGDMDFKVAGTRTGITAIQLDIKLGGISMDVVKDAILGAKTAREQILDRIQQVIAEPRRELSVHAPRIETLKIDVDKIRDLIGPGGKVINKLIDEYDVKIDIEEDGTVFVTSEQAENMQRALDQIKGITRVIQEGEVIEGPVTQIMADRNTGREIGAIVELGPNQDGMIHISAVCNQRIGKVSDVLKVGDRVKVKVMGVDKERGRIELSRKALLDPSQPDPLCPPGVSEPEPPQFGRPGGRRPFGQRPFGGARSRGPRQSGGRPPRQD